MTIKALTSASRGAKYFVIGAAILVLSFSVMFSFVATVASESQSASVDSPLTANRAVHPLPGSVVIEADDSSARSGTQDGHPALHDLYIPIIFEEQSPLLNSSSPEDPNKALRFIDEIHVKSVPAFLAQTDGVGIAAQTVTTTITNESAAPVNDLYPKSLEAYRHPFGSCGFHSAKKGTASRRKIIPFEYSTLVFGSTDSKSENFSKFWPNYPDLRDSPFLGSEHERCHFVMARMLAIIATVMKKFKMTTWFVTHATLLGAVRHGGFIPWDVDIDIAMPRSHLTFMRKRWRREFPRDMFLQSEKTDTAFHMWNGKERAIRVKDRYSNFPGMRFTMNKGSKKFRQKKMHLGAHVDIIPLEKKGGGKYKILHNYFEAGDIFPLRDVCFENMMLPAPNNIGNFLSVIYGKDYMTPPQNASFGGQTVLPCYSMKGMRGSPWSLFWHSDHPPVHRSDSGENNELRGDGAQLPVPKRWPRDDPDHGTYFSDFKTPHRLYYNSKW